MLVKSNIDCYPFISTISSYFFWSVKFDSISWNDFHIIWIHDCNWFLFFQQRQRHADDTTWLKRDQRSGFSRTIHWFHSGALQRRSHVLPRRHIRLHGHETGMCDLIYVLKVCSIIICNVFVMQLLCTCYLLPVVVLPPFVMYNVICKIWQLSCLTMESWKRLALPTLECRNVVKKVVEGHRHRFCKL